MTVSTTQNKVICLGDNVTTVFTYNFIIPLITDIEVYYTDASNVTTLLSQSLYSVSGLGNSSGGTVTYPLSGAAIVTGTTLTILRANPLTQDFDITDQQNFSASTVEAAFDNVVMQIQDINEIISRAPTLMVTSQEPTPILAAPVPNQYLIYDATGTIITSTPMSGGGGGGGSGNVTGPSSSVNGNFAYFGNTTGTLLTDSGNTSSSFDAAGAASSAITAHVAASNPHTQYALITSLGTMAVQNANNVTITGGSVTGMPTPVNGSDVAIKSYVDNAVTGIAQHANAVVVTVANLTSTYNNGTAGVGATLTNATTQAAFSADSVSPTINQRVLVAGQTTAANNGIYTLTTLGSVSTNWVLTRATDYNSASNIGTGGSVVITSGTTYAGTLWFGNVVGTVTVGTTAISFTEINVGSQTTTLTGDITGSGAGTIATTIANSAVTVAKMANLAAHTFLGNNTGSVAAPSAQAFSTILQAANNLSDVATASVAFNTISPITTKGDFIVGSGTNTSARLAVGTDGYLPYALSTASAGIKWCQESEWNLAALFGLVGDFSTDNHVGLQNALSFLNTTGGCGALPAGGFATTVALSQTFTATSIYNQTRPRIKGAGAGVCGIFYSGTSAPTSYIMSLIRADGSDNAGLHSFCPIEGITIAPVSATQNFYIGGIYLQEWAYLEMHNVWIHHCTTPLQATQVISSTFIACSFITNNYGPHLIGGSIYGDNANTFIGCIVGANSLGGLSLNNGSIKYLGGSIEENGHSGTSGSGYGLLVQNTQAGSSVAIDIDTYFEGNGTTGDAGTNASTADIWIIHADTNDNLTYCIENCNFNRLASNYAPYSIYVDKQASTAVTMKVQGCSFMDYGGYTASANRKYIKFNDGGGGLANINIQGILGNFYNQSIERPDFIAQTAFYVGGGEQLGALVYPSVQQSIPNSTTTDLIYSTAVYNNYSIWASGSPTKLTVPANAQFVRVGCGQRMAATSTANAVLQFSIRKNGAVFVGAPHHLFESGSTSSIYEATLWSPWLPAGSDYYTASVSQGTGGSLNTDSNFNPQWFAMEIRG